MSAAARSSPSASMPLPSARANKGYNVTVIQGDHQNEPDVGMGLARQWFDNGADPLIDVPNSAVALAIAGVAAPAPPRRC